MEQHAKIELETKTVEKQKRFSATLCLFSVQSSGSYPVTNPCCKQWHATRTGWSIINRSLTEQQRLQLETHSRVEHIKYPTGEMAIMPMESLNSTLPGASVPTGHPVPQANHSDRLCAKHGEWCKSSEFSVLRCGNQAAVKQYYKLSLDSKECRRGQSL
eukprot:12554-Amphidinium_carterae.1